MGQCSSHVDVEKAPDPVVGHLKARDAKADVELLPDSSDSDAAAKARALLLAGARGGAASLKLPDKLALAQALAAAGPERSSRPRRQSQFLISGMPCDDRAASMPTTSGRLGSCSSMPSRVSPNASTTATSRCGAGYGCSANYRTASGPSGGYIGSGTNSIRRADSGGGGNGSKRSMDDTDAVIAVAKALNLSGGGGQGVGRTQRRSSWASTSTLGAGSAIAAVASSNGAMGPSPALTVSRQGRNVDGPRSGFGLGMVGAAGAHGPERSRLSPAGRRSSTGTIVGNELSHLQRSSLPIAERRLQHRHYSFHARPEPAPPPQQQQPELASPNSAAGNDAVAGNGSGGGNCGGPCLQSGWLPGDSSGGGGDAGAASGSDEPQPAACAGAEAPSPPQPRQQLHQGAEGRRPGTPSTPGGVGAGTAAAPGGSGEDGQAAPAAASPASPAPPASPAAAATAAAAAGPRRFLPRWSSLQRPPVDLGAQPKRPALKASQGSPAASTCASPVSVCANLESGPTDTASDPSPPAERLLQRRSEAWGAAAVAADAAAAVARVPAAAPAGAARDGEARSPGGSHGAAAAAVPAWDVEEEEVGGDGCEGGVRKSAPLPWQRPQQLLLASPSGTSPRPAAHLSPLSGGGRGDTRLSPRPGGTGSRGGAAVTCASGGGASPFSPHTHPHAQASLLASPLSPSRAAAAGAASPLSPLHQPLSPLQPHSPARAPGREGASPLGPGAVAVGGSAALGSSGGSGRLIADLRCRYSLRHQASIGAGGGGASGEPGGVKPAPAMVSAEAEAGPCREEAEQCSLPGGVPCAADLAS